MEKKKVGLSIIKIILFIAIVIFIAVILARYLTNSEFRENINIKLFGKEISQNTLKTIEIDAENDANIYAFDEYIAILEKNKIKMYNNTAEEIYSSDIFISNPLEMSCGKYMLLAENNGNRVALLDKMGIKWENTVTGEIYSIHVNKNGYVIAVSKDSTYESIITVFDCSGKELIKKFLAKGYAVSATLSNNNQYLAIGKVDYSGAIIKSSVEFISINEVDDKAILNLYEDDIGSILINMKFNSQNDLICVFDSYVEKITDSEYKKIYEITDNDIFIDIDLKDNILIAQKESSGLFSYDYQIILKSTIGKSDSLYILEKDIPKRIISTEEICCIRFANEIRLINSNGWLIKKYNTTKDIQNIIMGDKIMAILYNNKIEIISL